MRFDTKSFPQEVSISIQNVYSTVAYIFRSPQTAFIDGCISESESDAALCCS